MKSTIDILKLAEPSALESKHAIAELVDVLKVSSSLILDLLDLDEPELTRRGREVAKYIALRDAIQRLSISTPDGDGDAD